MTAILNLGCVPAQGLAGRFRAEAQRRSVVFRFWKEDDRIGRLVPDPVACIVLASVILLYWGAKERQDAATLLGILAGWLTGIPGMSTVGQWSVRGAVYMFATIKRKVYEQILADGRSQGHSEGHVEGRQQTNAEWDAWPERRTRTGVFIPDDNDPPPSRAAD